MFLNFNKSEPQRSCKKRSYKEGCILLEAEDNYVEAPPLTQRIANKIYM